MNTFTGKCLAIFLLAWGPMIFAFMGPYALPIVLVSWAFAFRKLCSLIDEVEKEELDRVKKEERRAVGQTAHRSRVVLRERTHSNYSNKN